AVNVCSALQSRGLSAADAARVLDSGLALRLTLYVSADDGNSSSSSSSSSEATADSSAGAGATAAGRLADFAFGLQLDDGRCERFSFESHVRSPSSYFFYSGRRRAPEGAGWLRAEHLVVKCPRGFRRASVLLRARGAAGGAAGAAPAVRFGSVELYFVPAYEP
ncbi:hypothetical protein MNEG_6485, partial [Monoraphidium neglectum]